MNLFLFLVAFFALIFGGEPVEGVGKYQHAVVYYFEPHLDWDDMCLENSTYPILTFCSKKIANLEDYMPLNYTCADIGSLTNNGLIVEYAKPNYASNATMRITIPGFETCVAWQEEYAPLSNPRSFRYLGNPDPELPGLSLFSDEYVYGEETYVDDDIQMLDAPLKVGYWAMTGHDNWTLYAEPNFEGESACLIPEEWAHGWAFGTGSFVLADGSSLVNSIQRGCHSGVILKTDVATFEAQRDSQGRLMSLVKHVRQDDFIDGDDDMSSIYDVTPVSKGAKLVEDCLLA